MHAFSEMGIGATLGKAKGFLNFSADLLMSDVVELLPKDQVVIEVLETVEITDDILRRCQELKDMGFTLALDDFAEFRPEYDLGLTSPLDACFPCRSTRSRRSSTSSVRSRTR